MYAGTIQSKQPRKESLQAKYVEMKREELGEVVKKGKSEKMLIKLKRRDLGGI